MLRCAEPQPLGDLAPVDLADRSGIVDHRDHQRSVEVLVPGVAQDAQALQPSAELGAGHPVPLRQAKTERAVREPELEVLDGFGVIDPARVQIGQRLGRGLQRLVVLTDHLGKERLIIGIARHRRRQRAHRRLLHRATSRRSD
jgi:hypothetical protein